MLNSASSDHDGTFKALADRHRRRILAAVCESPRVAGELAGLVGLAPNAVSFHLKELKTAGLVRVQREGRHLRYHPVLTALAEWREHLGALFAPASFSELRPATEAARRSRQRPDYSPSITAPMTSAPQAEVEALPTELL